MPVQPPKPQLPPLNALRAFESAARLNSFKAAGEELHVTPGAIAQHIKALEAWAAGELFTRNARGVELTPLGRAALPAFSAAFDLLGSAVHGLSASAAPDLVRIAALPSIAQLWVSPRLPAIRKEMPQLQISLTALDGRPNFNREIFDLQLFFEPEGAVLDTGTVKLAEDFILPVCAPLIARQIRSVADLEHTPV